MLGGLIDHFTNLTLTGAPEDFDLLGRVYEFFLGEFSAMQGRLYEALALTAEVFGSMRAGITQEELTHFLPEYTENCLTMVV